MTGIIKRYQKDQQMQTMLQVCLWERAIVGDERVKGVLKEVDYQEAAHLKMQR